ncbi:helix-turn-helix domain-containing protein [Kibdelosporangium lantanae]|uniref:Helix-turn-helix domain-containing protein n=1 Tax=Kibdelosporangium lantanae TaxID=1497396 RepID=A0ABW3M1Q9_9PSEU
MVRPRTALIARREALGFSQESFAEKLGAHSGTVGRWERGESDPQPWRRRRIADALGISLDELDDMISHLDEQPPQVAVVELTVLGCEPRFPRPGHPCSGYLLQAGADVVWVDAGAGTFVELQRRVDLADLSIVWISSLRPDYWSDLVVAWNAYANDDSLPRLRVVGPPGWGERLDGAVGRQGAAAEVFDVHELSDGLEAVAGGIRLRAYAAHNSSPRYALRAEVAGKVVVYSLASGPYGTLADLANGTTLLAVEVEENCSLEDVAAVAASGGRVLVTYPGGVDKVVRHRLRQQLGPDVEIARPGLTLRL